MFCPKCGAQNADEAKYCRGCGVDVSNVLAVVDRGQPPAVRKNLNFFAAGLGGMIIGSGLVIAAVLALAISPRLAVLTIFALAFASIFLGVGIGLMVKARGLKSSSQLSASDNPTALPSGEQDYIQPERSIYETDDLLTAQGSVTDRTTKHLKMDRE